MISATSQKLKESLFFEYRLYNDAEIEDILIGAANVRNKMESTVESLDSRTHRQLQHLFRQLGCIKAKKILDNNDTDEGIVIQTVWNWRMMARVDRNGNPRRRETNSFMLFKMDMGKLFEASKLTGQSLDQKLMNKYYSKMWSFLKNEKENDGILKFYVALSKCGKELDQLNYDLRLRIEGAAFALISGQELGIVSQSEYVALLPNIQSMLYTKQVIGYHNLPQITADLSYLPPPPLQDKDMIEHTFLPPLLPSQLESPAFLFEDSNL